MDEKQRYQMEQWETMQAIKDTIKEIGRTHSAQCRYCDYVATGADFGEVLEDLGGHGEYFHKGIAPAASSKEA